MSSHQFESPTTPGLMITLRAYIIELMCLNIDSRIGPRFWSNKKWQTKFGRESRGVSNMLKQLGEIDGITQTAILNIIENRSVKSLMRTATVDRVVKWVKMEVQSLKAERARLASKQIAEKVDPAKNSTFVPTGMQSRLGKIRDMEHGKKEN